MLLANRKEITLLTVLASLVIFLQAVDLVSTYIGLSRGIPEANPVLISLAKLVGIYGAVALAKCAVIACCVFSWREIARINNVLIFYGAIGAYAAMAYLYLLTVHSNYLVIYG